MQHLQVHLSPSPPSSLLQRQSLRSCLLAPSGTPGRLLTASILLISFFTHVRAARRILSLFSIARARRIAAKRAARVYQRYWEPHWGAEYFYNPKTRQSFCTPRPSRLPRSLCTSICHDSCERSPCNSLLAPVQGIARSIFVMRRLIGRTRPPLPLPLRGMRLKQVQQPPLHHP